MKAITEYTSTYKKLGDDLPVKEGLIEIKSLEDLIALHKKVKHPLIISTFNCDDGIGLNVEIYNTWRE